MNCIVRVLPVRAAFLLAAFGLGGEVLAAAPAPESRRADADEPRVERIVIEDQGSRVEELRVRGQTRRIVVRTKGSDYSYEIAPPDPARDAAPGPSHGGGSAGKRSWKILSF